MVKICPICKVRMVKLPDNKFKCMNCLYSVNNNTDVRQFQLLTETKENRSKNG